MIELNMIILSIMIITISFTCIFNRSKISRIKSLVSNINNSKLIFNRLLCVSMSKKDIIVMITELTNIRNNLDKLDSILDENSKTKDFRNNFIIKQTIIIDSIVYNMLTIENIKLNGTVNIGVYYDLTVNTKKLYMSISNIIKPDMLNLDNLLL